MQSGKCLGRVALLMTSLPMRTIRGPSLRRPIMNKFKSLLLYGKSVMCIQFGSCVALLFSAQQCFLHCGPKRASSKKTETEATDSLLTLSLQFKYL